MSIRRCLPASRGLAGSHRWWRFWPTRRLPERVRRRSAAGCGGDSVRHTVLMAPRPGPDLLTLLPESGARFLDVLVRILSDEALAASVREIEGDAASRR
jgi:hypothetical protein